MIIITRKQNCSTSAPLITFSPSLPPKIRRLPGYLSIHLFIYLSIYLFIYLSIYQSIYLSIYLFIHLSIYPSIYPMCIPQPYFLLDKPRICSNIIMILTSGDKIAKTLNEGAEPSWYILYVLYWSLCTSKKYAALV